MAYSDRMKSVVAVTYLAMLLALSPYLGMGMAIAMMSMPILFFLIMNSKFDVDVVALILIAMTLFLDVPAERPYYDHDPITEVIGSVFFNSLSGFGIPLPFRIFEILTWSCLIVLLVKRKMFFSDEAKVLLAIAAAIPAISIIGVLIGQAKGNQLGLAFTQVRGMQTFPAWCLIGFYLGRKPAYIKFLLAGIVVSSLAKSIYSLIVYFGFYGGDLGDREYLIDHIASLFLGLAMVIIVSWNLFSKRVYPTRLLLSVGGLVLLAVPFVLNDRRTAMLGLLIFSVCFPFLLSKKKLIQLRTLIYIASPVVVIGLAILFVMLFIPSSQSENLQSYIRSAPENALTYRTIEDYNLLSGVRFSPILGLGFGTTYPIMIFLPDISFVYDLFDAIPHNQVLFIWVFAGPLGLAALSTITVISSAVTLKLSKYSIDGLEPLLGVVSFAALILWIQYVFFDMGLVNQRALTVVGLLIGMCLELYRKTQSKGSYS